MSLYSLESLKKQLNLSASKQLFLNSQKTSIIKKKTRDIIKNMREINKNIKDIFLNIRDIFLTMIDVFSNPLFHFTANQVMDY
jgi:hypothetical protein